MAKIEQMDRQEPEDRKLALLALEANEAAGKGGSSCPTDSELAALLDGQCQGEERKRLQEHIAGCDDCRRRCLEVGMALMEVNREPRRSKARIYTWASAFLAAAACVVLYLAIDITSPWQEKIEAIHPVPGSPEHVQSMTGKNMEKNISGLPERRKELGKDTNRPYADQGLQARGIVHVQKTPTDEHTVFQKRTTEFSQTKGEDIVSPAPETHAMEKNLAAGQMVNRSEQSRFLAWRALLEAACARQEQSPVIWKALYQEGREVVQIASPANRREAQRLLENMHPDNQSSAWILPFCNTFYPRSTKPDMQEGKNPLFSSEKSPGHE